MEQRKGLDLACSALWQTLLRLSKPCARTYCASVPSWHRSCMLCSLSYQDNRGSSYGVSFILNSCPIRTIGAYLLKDDPASCPIRTTGGRHVATARDREVLQAANHDVRNHSTISHEWEQM